MLKKSLPIWVVIGGFVLTLMGGFINAIGFLGVYHQAVSHMSGAVTTIGLNLAAFNAEVLVHTGSVVAAFFVGAMLSGFIIRQSVLQLGRRYGAVLAVESVLLFAAAHFLRQDLRLGDYLAAMACGLQNAMATSYSGSVIRTTHITGMVTDFGIACGHMLRRQSVEWRRFRLYGVLLTGFLSGSFLGAVAFAHYSYDALIYPAMTAGCTGLSYAVMKHIKRQQHQRSEKALLLDLPSATAYRVQSQARKFQRE